MVSGWVWVGKTSPFSIFIQSAPLTKSYRARPGPVSGPWIRIRLKVTCRVVWDSKSESAWVGVVPNDS